MDRLNSMRVFARVAELGSFASAARAMDLSPAVVTRLVADLERHLGARLINRTTRRLALTETGQDYLRRVQDVLERIDEADNVARDAGSEAAGLLRVAAVASFAVHAIVPALTAFRAQFPQVVIDLTAVGSVLTEADDEFDLTVMVAAELPRDAAFVARRLACTEFIACASPEYLDRHPLGTPRRPEDLRDHHCIFPAFAQPGDWSFQPRGEGRPVAVDQPSVLIAHHIEVLRAAAEAGLGISTLPSYIAAPLLASGKLRWVLSSWRLPSAGIWAALPTRRYLPARTRVFLDWMVQTFGGEEVDPWLKASAASS